MFGGDGAIQLRDQVMYDAIDFTMGHPEFITIWTQRLGRIVVNIAITNMTKGYATYAGIGAL